MDGWDGFGTKRRKIEWVGRVRWVWKKIGRDVWMGRFGWVWNEDGDAKG